MTETKLLVPVWPILCDSCGQALAQKVVARHDFNAISIFCPHEMTFALAHVSVLDDTRAVTRWEVSGPLSEADAISLLDGFSGKAVSLENRRLN